ncbi:MAG: hypothetical protein IBX66_12360 [Lutibacter sp.]|nr:hypothetical protein [Lutibacter sp.]
MKNARIKDARMGTKADKRYENAIRKSTEPTNKPTEIITDEDFKMAPQTDIDTKYLRIKNHQNVQIPKGSLQLIAPLLSVQNVNDTLVYAWTVTNKEENIEESFIGNSINYDFNNAGNYTIDITPMLNGQKLQPYQILVIIN